MEPSKSSPRTPDLLSKLPLVGTTIFTVMSTLAAETGAVNLGQGFPDFDCDPALVAAVSDAMARGLNQYPPMTGVTVLREAIAAKLSAWHGPHGGRAYDAATEITVTAGATQAITLRFSHPAGIAELGILNALINRALDGGNACYIAFSQPLRVLYLVNNAGPDAGLSGPLTLGATGSVSNSQCTIYSAGSSVSATNTELTLTLNIAFSSAFSGNRVIYLAARSVAEQNSGWQSQGVSALPETTPPFPRSGVLSPTVGTTAAATLTATFLDATNATNIQTTWLLINSAVNADRACYVAYYRPGNLLLLFPDSGDGNLATAMPLSGSGFLENSQCRIDAQGSSVTVVGNALTLNLNTVFKPAFAGPRVIFGALNSSAANSLWKPLGFGALQNRPSSVRQN